MVRSRFFVLPLIDWPSFCHGLERFICESSVWGWMCRRSQPSQIRSTEVRLIWVPFGGMDL